jgi:hypothetical protein
VLKNTLSRRLKLNTVTAVKFYFQLHWLAPKNSQTRVHSKLKPMTAGRYEWSL